jgi:uncharacterized Zn-binding protein involved in type VI secretion
MRKAMLLLVVFGLAGSLWAQSPFDGTWKVDIFGLFTIVLQNGIFQCSTCNPPVTLKADGTDHAVQGAELFDTEAVKVVDDKTVEVTRKKSGKVIIAEKNTVSPDGKMLAFESTAYFEASKQPLTLKATGIRVSEGPTGSHAYSGSWRMNMENLPTITFTYKTSPDGLIMTYQGESYVANFDGKDYPYKGNPNITSVSLTRENDNSMVENYKRDGKIVTVVHATVSADGKTLTIKEENKAQGTTLTVTATKQ